MKISNLTECTTAGAVATVAQPFETVQKRTPEKKLKGSNLLKGIKTSAKYANSLHEGEVVQFPGAHTHDNIDCPNCGEPMQGGKMPDGTRVKVCVKCLKYRVEPNQNLPAAAGTPNLSVVKEDKQSFTVGQKVEVHHGGAWVPATITAVDRPGKYKIRLSLNGKMVDYVSGAMNTRAVAEGLKFNGGTPDVDHMNGPIMRGGEGMSKACPHCNGNRYIWTNSEQGKTPKHPWINPNTATLKSKQIPCPACQGDKTKEHTDTEDGRNHANAFGTYRYESVEEAQSLGGALNNALSKVEPGSKLDQKIKTHNRQVKSGVKDKQFMMTSPPEGYHFKQDGSVALGEGAKVDRMVGHVKSSEKKLGKSSKEAENIAWATANKRGMLDNKNKKVNEGILDEFAPSASGDDGEEFNPGLAKMAKEEGEVKGFSLSDGATLASAIKINYWDTMDGGTYAQFFARGFKEGRLRKINHGNKQYNLNLKLMKDGSIRHGEQGVAESVDYDEITRAHELMNRAGDADMSYEEIVDLLVDNGFSQEVADHMALDSGRQPENRPVRRQQAPISGDRKAKWDADLARILGKNTDQGVAEGYGPDGKWTSGTDMRSMLRPTGNPEERLDRATQQIAKDIAKSNKQKRVPTTNQRKNGVAEGYLPDESEMKTVYRATAPDGNEWEVKEYQGDYLIFVNGEHNNTFHATPGMLWGAKDRAIEVVKRMAKQGVAEGFDDNNTEIARNLLPRLNQQSGGSTVEKCAALAAKYFNSAGLQSKFDIDEYIKQEMANEGVTEGSANEGREPMVGETCFIRNYNGHVVLQGLSGDKARVKFDNGRVETVSRKDLIPQSEKVNSLWEGNKIDEGRFVKGPGGVPLDRQGNAIPPKPQAEPKAPNVRRDANGLTRADYNTVWRKIEDVVGQIFPDGDPIDWLGPWLDRQGITGYRIGDILRKACQMNGFKDIYAYYDHFKTDDYGYEAPVREAMQAAPAMPTPAQAAAQAYPAEPAPEEPETDPELRSAEQSANVHYASAAKRKKGIEKFLLRSVKHAKEADTQQNLEIRKIKRDMDAIRKMASNGPVAEGEITEDDVVLSADRRKPKSGLLSKPEPTTNPADAVKVDIPLLIRLLEFAREDAKTDMDLHDLAEKLIACGARGRTLTMKDYERLVPEKKPEYNDATDSVEPEVDESLLGGAAAAGIIANDDDEDFQVSFQRQMEEDQTNHKFRILAFLKSNEPGDVGQRKEFTITARTDREAKILAKQRLAARGMEVRELHIIGSEEIAD